MIAHLVETQWRAIVVVIVLLAIGGLVGMTRVPLSLFPTTDFPRIIIVIENGEVPAPQMLVTVTRPVEEAMSGIPGIAHIRSVTSRGATEIDLFFDWRIDVEQTLQIVQARLSRMATSLPPAASIKRVERLTFAVFPILGYSVTSTQRDPGTLRALAELVLRPPLARVPGVASVDVQGGEVHEYHATLDPVRLEARGLTVSQAVDALQTTNVIESPGLIEENHQLELALVSGQAQTLDDLGRIVVGNVGGVPVLLSDVATLGPGFEPRYTIVTADGQPAVLVNVLRQPTANTVAVADTLKQQLTALERRLPRDVHVTPYYDQSLLVRGAVGSVRDAILIGLVLSVLILYGFLRSWGTTLVATVVIPVTILVTMLAMWLIGLTFDLMTLGGVAAAIGLVIDDAIVVVENIYAHAAAGASRADAVRLAMNEITGPIVFSTITPVVVFLPLSLLTGVTGVFFRSLALTMAVALLTSLVLALFFTPVLARRFVTTNAKAAHATHDENGPILRRAIGGYERLLELALRHTRAVLVLIVALLVLAYVIYRMLGSEFLPEFDEGGFILDYTAPAGASLAETDRILLHVERLLRATPDVESFSRRTGMQLGLAGVTEPNTGDFAVKLKPEHRDPEVVMGELRQKIESTEPALRVEFIGILSDLIGDLASSPSPIEIRLYSEDQNALQRTARAVAASIAKVDGVVEVFDGIVVSGPAITFRVDPLRAATYGVTAADVTNTIEAALGGTTASSILERGVAVNVRVLLPPAYRQSLDAVRALRIHSPVTNGFVRVDQLATIEYDPGQTEIDRDGLRQSIAVTARLEGSDLGSAIAKIRGQLAKDVHLPAGMSLEYGGLYQEQQSSFRELAFTLLLAVALVFLVLLVEFRSFAHPIAIVTGAVLALTGTLLALLVTGTTLNVVSLMGMIMIVGIVAKNGILMLDTVEDHLAAGDDLHAALVRSGRRRFRPVLMTSLAAMLGMSPLALALGSGAELLQPLAIAVIGGLAFALLLSLVVTPSVYAMIRKERRS
ncbi:MAG: efflux RND transporter permease subunit [Acidobacteria bacterium]|nr:efflux RND transporter permease subunit [Acidobacteriota bacterium]MBV9475447.1 efflux RND transporter permease subunit [Acidobacteriota bacterium]